MACLPYNPFHSDQEKRLGSLCSAYIIPFYSKMRKSPGIFLSMMWFCKRYNADPEPGYILRSAVGSGTGSKRSAIMRIHANPDPKLSTQICEKFTK